MSDERQPEGCVDGRATSLTSATCDDALSLPLLKPHVLAP